LGHVLEVKEIRCRYERDPVVDGLSFGVAEGGLACLLGPSGCGKTTVLRAIAGFHPIERGEIRIAGRTVSRPGFVLAPERRRVGMVFQDHALFPHMTVRQNVAAGLRHLDRRRGREVADALLARVGLADLAGRYPHELSGGQQQRVALARALAPHPHLLLMDEPFSNLDVELRERLGHEIQDLLRENGITCVIVTHDQHDAFALAEHVGVMSEGRILQWDTPYNLYHEPNSRFIANFVGEGVFLPGTMLTPSTVRTELGVVAGNRAYPWPSGSDIDVLVRPDDIVPADNDRYRAEVMRKAFKGAETMYTLRLESGRRVLSLFPSHRDYEPGELVSVELRLDHLVAFVNDGGGQNR
jgi:iron(III) transport system ATP-binding protein